MIEELARECPALAIASMNQMSSAAFMLRNPAAAARWFEGAASGTLNTAAAFTDPVGITNYKEHPEIAQRDGSDYVVNGVRWFVTQGLFADVIRVGGIVEDDMHLFWIDAKQSGVKITPMPKMGVGAPGGCLELTDVRVPAELVNDLSAMVKDRELINVDGAGAGTTHLVSAMSLGLADGVWEKTDAFVRERTFRDRPLASMQALQHKLVRMKQNIEAGRSMLYDAAQLVDAGRATAFSTIY